jgi:hypothetical protein
MDPDLDHIVECLQRHRVRATYKAVGEAANIPARSVGSRLGDRCALASWVVNASTGLPTGYARGQMHPELLANDVIIDSGDDLIRLMKRGRL